MTRIKFRGCKTKDFAWTAQKVRHSFKSKYNGCNIVLTFE